ncbi:MAG: HAMP domain-containing protein, partial [Burkholderiales bacterium]|nr:HAMP domain-containing protein [Burkholderiales bacterium]
MRSITQPLERAVDLADAIAAGDLTVNIQDDRRDELGHLLRSLNAMGAKLREVVGEVRSGVES